MKFELNSRNEWHSFEVEGDNFKASEEVYESHFHRDEQGKVTHLHFREPNDDFTQQAVQLLEDVAYHRRTPIKYCSEVIKQLLDKMEEKELLELLRYIKENYINEYEEQLSK